MRRSFLVALVAACVAVVWFILAVFSGDGKFLAVLALVFVSFWVIGQTARRAPARWDDMIATAALAGVAFVLIVVYA